MAGKLRRMEILPLDYAVQLLRSLAGQNITRLYTAADGRFRPVCFCAECVSRRDSDAG
jgi:hypothetical protein